MEPAVRHRRMLALLLALATMLVVSPPSAAQTAEPTPLAGEPAPSVSGAEWGPRPWLAPSLAVGGAAALTAGPSIGMLAQGEDHLQFREHWLVIHGALLAGPALGYAAGNRSRSSLPGLLLRTGLMAGAQLDVGLDSRAVLDRSEQLRLGAWTGAMAIASAWDLYRLDRELRSPHPLRDPDPQVAYAASLYGTIAPAAACGVHALIQRPDR